MNNIFEENIAYARVSEAENTKTCHESHSIRFGVFHPSNPQQY